MKQPITDRTILRVLITGFSFVLALLLVSGAVGIRNAQAIRESAQELAEEQATYSRLIDEIYREQGALNAVFDRLSKEPDSVDRDEILKQLLEADTAIAAIVETVAGKTDEKLWRNLQTAILAFSKEARRLLAQENASSLFSYDLLERHEEVLEIVRKLIASGSARSERAQEVLSAGSQRLVQQTLLLAGACLLLALVVAIYTVRMTASLSRKMEWQASELSRVSWQMLENQESAARRFSHELHDELGQSLTAVKANLVAINQKVAGEPEAEERVQDCLHLVDEAVSNVREMSQLLRPTILDDFGLEAGLRWLTERFTQRTRIAVSFTSNVKARLPDETETHLFRIAQEALTNIARHSGATHVEMEFARENGKVRLRIGDNGKGLADPDSPAHGGIGMTGMRARARGVGGELVVTTKRGGEGLTLEVWAPGEGTREVSNDEQESTNPVGG